MMSEVSRYWVNGDGYLFGCSSAWEPKDDELVMWPDFKRVQDERDALQQLLNAADQRIDEQAGLLRRCVSSVREQHCDPGEADFDLPAELMADIDAQLSASTEPEQDDDWHMNPCKQGHRDVGASGGVAACNQCDEKIEAATTQEAFERWNATHLPSPVTVVMPDRSPEDYAIEHAEYMADSADDVLAKFQAYGLALLAVDEGGDDGEGELFEAIDAARQDLQESLVDMRGMVYEFRKRFNRCTPQ
jgi:hypothetical protein